MRYKIVEHQGVKYGLRRGQTAEQLAALLPEYEDTKFIFGENSISGDVKDSYLIFTEYGLVDRSRITRKHHKPKPSQGVRPRTGPGSGRAGGARVATHYSNHVAGGRVPKGIRPEECDICQYGGLLAWLRKQCENEGEADDLPRQASTPVETRVSRLYGSNARGSSGLDVEL